MSEETNVVTCCNSSEPCLSTEDVAAKKARNKLTVDVDEFCRVWNDSPTAKAVGKTLGLSTSFCSQKASALRKQGKSLKLMKVPPFMKNKVSA